MTNSDFLWQFVVIAVFGALGYRVCRGLVNGESVRAFPAILQKARHLYLVLPALIISPSLAVAVATHPERVWAMPGWLQLHWAALSWGTVCGVMAYVFGFCAVAANAGERRNKRWPIYFGGAVLLTIQAYAAWSSRPNLPPLGPPRISRDGVILQTTPFTCVPASGANIAAILGVPTSEKELVQLFHTTRDGTFPAAALRGLSELGIAGKKVTLGSDQIRALHPPAMLFVLNDTHALVYVGEVAGRFEFWNPSNGRGFITEEHLRNIWSGHALEFQRKR